MGVDYDIPCTIYGYRLALFGPVPDIHHHPTIPLEGVYNPARCFTVASHRPCLIDGNSFAPVAAKVTQVGNGNCFSGGRDVDTNE